MRIFMRILGRFFSWYPAGFMGLIVWSLAYAMSSPKGFYIPPSGLAFIFAAGVAASLCGGMASCVQWRAVRDVVQDRPRHRTRRLFYTLGLALLLSLCLLLPEAVRSISIRSDPILLCDQKYACQSIIRATVQRCSLEERHENLTWRISLLVDECDEAPSKIQNLFIGSLCQVSSPPPLLCSAGDIIEVAAQISLDPDAEIGGWRRSLKPDWRSCRIVGKNRLSGFLGEAAEVFGRYIHRAAFALYPADCRVRGAIISLLFGFPLDKELRGDIHRVGLDHLFAISGFHFNCLTGCVTLALVFCSGWVRSWSVLAAATIFLCLIGVGSHAVLRAWMAISIVSAGILLRRRASALNSLGLALGCICCIDPSSARSLGFQLSCLATWGILLYYAPIKRCVDLVVVRKRMAEEIEAMAFMDQCCYVILRLSASGLALSLSVWIMVAPYLFYFLDGITPIGLVYNLFVTPLFSFILASAFASFLFFPISSTVAAFLAKGASISLAYILSLIDATQTSALFWPGWLQGIAQLPGFFYIAFVAASGLGVVLHVREREAALFHE